MGNFVSTGFCVHTLVYSLWLFIKQKFVLGNGQVLAALAGLNFQVQFSMPYSIRFKRFSK